MKSQGKVKDIIVANTAEHFKFMKKKARKNKDLENAALNEIILADEDMVCE